MSTGFGILVVLGSAICAPVSAQPTASINPGCAQTGQIVRYQADCPGSSSRLAGGFRIFSVTSQGVDVSVILRDLDSYIRADLLVRNESAQSIEVRPDLSSLMATSPKYRFLKYETPAELARKTKKAASRAMFAAALAGSTPQPSTSQTTSSGSVSVYGNGGSANGTYSSQSSTVASTQNPEAQARAAQQMSTIAQNRDSAIAEIGSTLLLANTLDPQKQIQGAMLYEKDRAAKSLVLRIPVGAVIFEFPFSKP